MTGPADLDKAFNIYDRVGKLNVRLGAVIGILQAWSLTKARDDDLKAMAHESDEAKSKVAAAYGAVVGTFSEVLGEAAKRGRSLVLAGARGTRAAVNTLKAARWVVIGGKVLGAVAGFIVAFWDAMHFVEEARQRNIGMAVLYGSSAVLGMAVAVGTLSVPALAALTAWLPLLFIALVVIIVLIEIFKDNKIQDWLERTLWGTYRDDYKKSDPYKSAEFELKQFELALQG